MSIESGGDHPTSLPKRIEPLLAPHARPDSPGIVLAVSRGGRVLCRTAVGSACLERGVSASPGSRMRIGSTGKQFTAMLALLLAEDGLLDLDAPLTGYLPEVACHVGAPSLRQCLQHTSGLRCVQEIAFLAAGLTVQRGGRHLPAYARQTEANFKPGEVQLYNNGAYNLVSRAIERVTGGAFEDVLRSRLLEPLGLHDTVAVRSDMVVVPGVAALHTPDLERPGQWRKGLLPNEETLGEGCMFSTADDLLRWAGHLRLALAGHPSLGRMESWRALTTPAVMPDGARSVYALGLFVHEWRGLRVWRHPGGVIGGSCELLTIPELDLDIVVLSNGAMISPSALAYAVVEAVVEQPLPPMPVPASSEGLAHLFGHRYHCEGGLLLGFDDVGGRLGVSLQGSPHAPVMRDDGDSLVVGFEDLAMGPFRIRKAELMAASDAGPPAGIIMTEGTHAHQFVRLDGNAPEAQAMAQPLVGRFRSIDMDAEASIALENGQLRMTWCGSYGFRKLVLKPLSREVLLVDIDDPQAPGQLVMSLSFGAERVDSFHVSAGRTRHLRFQRLPVH